MAAGEASRRTAGGHVAAFLREYVRQSKGRWAGSALELEDWQQDFVDEAFLLDEHGVRVYQEAYLGIPKKNGKSTLASGLGLYLLVADGENAPEVFAGAGSKDQGRVVFDQASVMVKRSPRLSDFLRVQRSDIAAPFNDGVFRVVSSDGDLQHGTSPSGSIIDELWAHKNGTLHTALTAGSGAREQPLALTITTAGYDLTAEPLGPIYERAMALEDVEVRRDGFLRISRDREHGFLFVWYGPPPDAGDLDLDDPAVWKACNPASWITADYLRRQRHKPSVRLNDFRRFHLNQWTEAEESWISPQEWDACRGEVAIEEAEDVFEGVDIGQKHDSTAIVAAGWVGDELHVRARIREPTEGRPVAISDVELDILDEAEQLPVEEVAYDPARFVGVPERLEERGLLMVEFPQTDGRMGPASETLYELVTSRRLVHDGDPVLRAHVLAAVAGQTERGWRISKRRSKRRIDGAVALAMAVARAAHGEAQEEPFVEVIRPT